MNTYIPAEVTTYPVDVLPVTADFSTTIEVIENPDPIPFPDDFGYVDMMFMIEVSGVLYECFGKFSCGSGGADDNIDSITILWTSYVEHDLDPEGDGPVFEHTIVAPGTYINFPTSAIHEVITMLTPN